MKYAEECKKIWKSYVPASGQAEVLQGELLRQVEKLRYEAQNNGNRNWDDNFDYFCGFLKSHLCGGNLLSPEERRQVEGALDRLQQYGQRSRRFAKGSGTAQDEKEILEEKLGFAYVEDDLYDVLCDAVGLFSLQNPLPLPHTPNPAIRR